jgi:hypothetical protein
MIPTLETGMYLGWIQVWRCRLCVVACNDSVSKRYSRHLGAHRLVSKPPIGLVHGYGLLPESKDKPKEMAKAGPNWMISVCQIFLRVVQDLSTLCGFAR